MNWNVKLDKGLAKWLDLVGGGGRAHLFNLAANALHFLVQVHVQKLAATRHRSAQRLGASPTGHYAKAASGMSYSSDANSASVTIAAPGFNRAFKDVTITPTVARALTIPIHAMSYGMPVHSLVSIGWLVFRPKGKDFLMGKQKSSSDAPVPLYLLRARVLQKQDRSLLPSDKDIGRTVSHAMMEEINRIGKAA